MDYGLPAGVHDVDQAEQEEMEVQERAEVGECENEGVGGNLPCSQDTPPQGPGHLPGCPWFFGPRAFEPSVDVYAMKNQGSVLRRMSTSWPSCTPSLTPSVTKKKAACAARTAKPGAAAEILPVNPEQYSERIKVRSNIRMWWPSTVSRSPE